MDILWALLFTVIYWGIFWVVALWYIKTAKPCNLTTDDILIPLLLIWLTGVVNLIYFL